MFKFLKSLFKSKAQNEPLVHEGVRRNDVHFFTGAKISNPPPSIKSTKTVQTTVQITDDDDDILPIATLLASAEEALATATLLALAEEALATSNLNVQPDTPSFNGDGGSFGGGGASGTWDSTDTNSGSDSSSDSSSSSDS